MRSKKTDSEKERFLTRHGQLLDRFGGDHAISLLGIIPPGGEPTQRGTDWPMRLCVGDQRLFVFVTTFGIDGVIPGDWVVEAIGADRSGHVVVINLSHSHCLVASRLKGLRERDHLRHLIAEVPIEVVNLDLIRTQPSHQGGPGGVAQWQLVVCPLKGNAGGSQAIQMRRAGDLISIAAECAGQVVNCDEKNVGGTAFWRIAFACSSMCTPHE